MPTSKILPSSTRRRENEACVGRIIKAGLCGLGGRVVLLKESLLVRATLLRRPPYEAAYGVMMTRDESEWVRSNSFLEFTV